MIYNQLKSSRQPPQPSQEWVERFDALEITYKTPAGEFTEPLLLNTEQEEKIKSFIRNLLSSSRKNVIEEVGKIIEQIKTRFRCAACDEAKYEHTLGCQTLSDLKHKLTNL